MRTYCLLKNIDVSEYKKIKSKNVLEIVKHDIEYLSKANMLDLFEFKDYLITYFDNFKPIYTTKHEETILEKSIELGNKNIFPIGTDKDICYVLNIQLFYKIKNANFDNLKEVETVYNNWIKIKNNLKDVH